MADFEIKQHDDWPSLDATLSDADGPIDLTAAGTVKLIARTPTGAVTFEGNCTITDAAGGEVRFTLTTSHTATANAYDAEFEITWQTGKVQTVPNVGYFSILVTPDLG